MHSNSSIMPPKTIYEYYPPPPPPLRLIRFVFYATIYAAYFTTLDTSLRSDRKSQKT